MAAGWMKAASAISPLWRLRPVCLRALSYGVYTVILRNWNRSSSRFSATGHAPLDRDAWTHALPMLSFQRGLGIFWLEHRMLLLETWMGCSSYQRKVLKRSWLRPDQSGK